MTSATIEGDAMRLTPDERYHRDAHFHAVVDMLESLVHSASYTPTELREAAMLAAIHYEERRGLLRPMRITVEPFVAPQAARMEIPPMSDESLTALLDIVRRDGE